MSLPDYAQKWKCKDFNGVRAGCVNPWSCHQPAAWSGHGASASAASHPLPGMQEQCPGFSGMTMKYRHKGIPPVAYGANQSLEGRKHIFHPIYLSPKMCFLTFKLSCLQRVWLTARSGCSLGAQRGGKEIRDSPGHSLGS